MMEIIEKGLSEIQKRIGISVSTLKIIALLTMIIDHIGALLFPDIEILRIIGRLSFPIYAYLIGEGCIYTKSKWKYLRNVGLTFIGFQLIATFIDNTTNICVLFGFSLFIIFTIIMDWARKNMNKRMLVPLLYAIFTGLILTFFDADYVFFLQPKYPRRRTL